MVEYRTFRNTDPPQLVDLWNVSLQGRGSVHLRNATPLERYVFSKPYFDPAGLFIAQEKDQCVGYAHAGGCQSEDGTETQGVTCAIMVRPSHRRRGIGTKLLLHCEEYLLQRGAQKLFGGGHGSLNPFYGGLYGGSAGPGFLKSDPLADPFFRRNRYQVRDIILVLQRKLSNSLKAPDARFAQLRHRFNITMGSPRLLGDWWEECTIGAFEPIEFAIEEREGKQVVGRALVWEMEAFSHRWNKPSVGILNFAIREDLRGQGLGKLLLTNLLRQMQEQFFEVAEIQIYEKNLVALSLLRSFGFETVDRGQVFLKTTT